ncbi:MAG: hypothetical protein M3R39_09200 [Actinomycetota bacterium]|nr:hypothetical protein [Actinomycetota bacterium]
MIKIAVIIGGALLMAGAALAGTLTSLDSTNSPTIGTTATLPATSTVRQEDRARGNELRGRANEPGEDMRGRANEVRGRANEPGQDVRGPCDELEHANDPRCTGAPAAGNDDNAADDRGADDSAQGSSGPGPNSGPSDRSGGGGSDDSSGHGGGGGEDNSGHGGGGNDD